MTGLSDDPTLGATLAPAGEPAPTKGPVAGPLARGDTLGRYLIVSELGRGGMGRVYAAYDPELDRKLAIKLLLRHGSATSSAGSRLQREAQAMAQLSHRNVVAVHDVGIHDDQIFVAMEFVEGETLADWMARGPHSWRAVLDRFVAAGRGLAAAHAIELVHRDFKPANVLLGGAGRVCVADFGLARRRSDPRERDDAHTDEAPSLPAPGPSPGGPTSPLVRSSESSENATTRADSLSVRLTQTGAFVGTPAYMAPEQYDGATLDARSDQFSFCVALWEALWGQRPFAGESPAAIAFAIHQGKLREPPADGPKVPSWLRRTVERGLAPKPDDRWPDMEALLAALTRDPALVRRRVATGVVALAGLAAAFFGPRLLADPEPAPPPLCEGADAAFGDSLGAEARAAIHTRYVEANASWADDHEARLLARLETWATDWTEAWTETCAATRIRGEQSEALLDERMLCLGRHRTRFGAFVEALPNASEDQLRDAIASVDELGDLRDCANPELVHARVPPPADPRRRAEYETLLAELDAITALNLIGRFDAVRVRLEPAFVRALASGHPRLEAEAHLVRGDYLKLIEERELASQHLNRGYAHALAAGMFAEAGRGANAIAMSLLPDEARQPEAAEWLRVADSLADYTGSDGLRLKNLESHGRYERYVGNPEGALPYQREAIRLASSRFGPESRRAGDAHFNLAVGLFELNRQREAIEEVRRAQAIWADTLGPDDPRSLVALNAHGVFAWRVGDSVTGSRLLNELIERRTRLFGPDHISVASAKFNLGSMLGDARDPRSVELLTPARDRYIEEYGADSVAAAQATANLALALSRTMPKRRGEAVAMIDEVIAIMRAKRQPSQPDLLTALYLGSEIHRRHGELAEAEALASEVLELLAATGNDNEGIMAEMCTEWASIHLAQGRPAEAITYLERGMAIAEHNIDAAGPRKVAERYSLMAEALAALGRDEEAEAAASIARARFDELPSPGPNDEIRARLEPWDPA